ncbi:MAG: hypothetical protein HOG60_06335, partial [Gammaproteobacteria bacterium]|nr:hypothetical protein [Gammaproteobacteria bacterium]
MTLWLGIPILLLSVPCTPALDRQLWRRDSLASGLRPDNTTQYNKMQNVVSMRRNQEVPKILMRSAGVLLLLTSSVVAASDGFINPAGPVAEALRD